MFGYILAAISGLISMAEAAVYFFVLRPRLNALWQQKKDFVDHLDSMKNKSEIMIRHDAQAFRDRLAVK